jgi:PAS domain S-box-containing protein
MQSLNSRASAIGMMNEELNAAGEGLAGNEDLLRSVLAGCGDCIKILDLEGRLRFMSEGGKQIMEVEDFSKVKGRPWPDFWDGAGKQDAARAVVAARSGQTTRFRGLANTAKGTSRFWDVQVSPIFSSEGKPSYLLCISRDVTEEWRATNELKEASERQAMLTGELQHRIRNTLAMVGAIANQTMRGDNVAAARDAFSARLMILGKAHDILTQTSWTGAPIQEVVEAALAPHRTGDRRIHFSGPDIQLGPKPALALALAAHELATNAVKYGALSTSGQVDIVWSNSEYGSGTGFRFTWTESGGPPVVEPSQSEKGFGSRLIERVLSNDFGGEARTFYRPGGLIFAPNVKPANSG